LALRAKISAPKSKTTALPKVKNADGVSRDYERRLHTQPADRFPSLYISPKTSLSMFA
jgi:hypothetical protein